LIESVNPASGEVLARIHSASERDYERVMERARSVAAEWRATPAPVRGEAVRLCTDALRRHKDALGSLVSLEMGKIKAEGDGEVQEMIDIGDFAVGQSRMLYGRTMHSERPLHRMYEQWHPLGVVGVISAFNFPVAVWAWNAFIAAVCGNATVWKPSPKGALCCLAVQQICNDALAAGGFPPIFLSFMEKGHDLAERFVDDPRVDLMSFTGSTAVGRQVGERVAARMGKSLLELGGNNAIILDQPIWTWPSRRSSSAPSAPPGNAVPAPVDCWCMNRWRTRSAGYWPTPMARCASVILWTRKRSWAR
jgi:aldehyde dehydrogenase (NAD+)